MTATTTGVLALGLLLAGCTSGGAGGDDDAASGGSSAGSGGSGSTASGEGTLNDLASCDDIASALGPVIDGLEPNSNNAFQNDQGTCAWLSPGVDASNVADASGILVVTQQNELSDSELQAQIDDAEAAEGVESIDDSRVSAFGGQAFSQTGTQQGITASVTTIISPHGLIAVTATGAGDTAPLSTDETLDAAYGLFD
ncbi:hypothetical protein ITJ55_09005 [Frigoribacterium sp. VKM Ac-1396]|uniref:hypothetical protein n=1 Tax=Frigoribacterium sp. VKM Ac-1396 TaxID=2783821 RepID=UPI00188AE54A|nr:hypothetical protein [Frigoribacterium sp. VKM Ac-1396]MBF4600949.1 hypothetical protein [Frigoribacterium sp. VKM Ac-1396]